MMDKAIADKAVAKRRRRAARAQKRTRPGSQTQPGLGAKVQDLAKTAVRTAADKFEEMATTAARKIKSTVS
jgi:hypothetical protein